MTTDEKLHFAGRAIIQASTLLMDAGRMGTLDESTRTALHLLAVELLEDAAAVDGLRANAAQHLEGVRSARNLDSEKAP